MRRIAAVVAALIMSQLSMMGQHEVVDLALPTDNDALFRGDGPAFYQHVERDYHGVKSTPWEGGQYGFVRDPMEVMGHTGAGLNQERAHLHLELNLMLNRNFEAWHDQFFKNDPNHNGIYNGINLTGMDIAKL